ncbi:asparagine synthase-related protein [Thalassospira povalilytica]|uniref:asparagine synthase-related protein n=1 Tax=Thalassospira povalilytica TaxID=732237 RepID=UPI003AA9A5D0
MREKIFISGFPTERESQRFPNDFEEQRRFEAAGKVVQISWSSVSERVIFVEDDDYAVLAFGYFYTDLCVDCANLAREVFLLREQNVTDLNGEFLVFCVSKKTAEVSVHNDRFASIQFHYFLRDNEFYGSFSFSDLIGFLKKNTLDFSWNFSAAYEYLCFRRIHGADTLCNEVYFLRAGHKLVWGNELKVSRYFSPTYSISNQQSEETAKLLAQALSASIDSKLSDADDCVLFLSGGHDTRVVLSALNKPAVCYTLGFAPDTREILRARELAELVSVPHRTILLDQNLYQKTYRDAVMQNGGQYNVANIFLGVDGVMDRGNVGLCGTGLDYFFQGMYIPNQMKKIFGYSLYPEQRHIPEDVPKFYLENFSSRLKFAGLDGLVKAELLPELKAKLQDKLVELYREALGFGASKLQAYHHLFLADPSRHYSYPDNLAMRTVCRLRTPCFDNRVYECFLSTDPASRFDRRLTRDLLDIFNPEFRKVPSANDDLPIVSRQMKLLHRVKRKLKRPPARETSRESLEAERTWPTNDMALRNTADARRVLEALSRDDAAAQYLDIEELDTLYRQWLSGDVNCPPHSADFLWNLAGLHAMISAGKWG